MEIEETASENFENQDGNKEVSLSFNFTYGNN